MLLAMPVLALAQGPKTSTQVKLADVASIQWESTEVSLGKIAKNVPSLATFKLVNTGKQPVVITQVQPSCGCTAAEFTKEPIPPGGTGYVKATYNAATLGAFRKQVTVSVSGEANPAVLLLTGTVE